MRKISGYIISVLILLPVFCKAQDTTRYPIESMKGIRIGIDVSKFSLPVIYGGGQIGFEATADAYVKDNIFATVEFGWLHANMNRDTAYQYKSNGFYMKAGIDYNLLKPRRPHSNDIVYAGVRYGFSIFNQDVSHITIPGYYWPDAKGQTIPRSNMNAHWLEFLLGVKAEVLKNFYIGLTFRGKFKLASSKDKYSASYWIPGYGSGSSGFALGLNYFVSYNIQF